MFNNSIENRYSQIISGATWSGVTYNPETGTYTMMYTPPVGLYFKRLTETAKSPTRNSGDAGFDLYADEDVTLYWGQVLKIKTGIAVQIPGGYYGDMRSRSSFWSKGVLVTGTIDNTYRGEVIVIMGWPCHQMTSDGYTFLDETDPVKIWRGDKIAQMVLERIDDNFQVYEVEELTPTDRGSGGFGSTGT